MNHPTEETINDYIDGGLSADERVDVERHLESCAQCARLAAELQDIVEAAASLPLMDPPERVWERLEPRLEQGAKGRRYLSILALAATLVLVTLAGVRYSGWMGRLSPPAEPVSTLALSVESELREAEGHYQKAISGLQQIADAEKGALDPATAATLQKNLAVIDQAIAESRAALNADPHNVSAEACLLQGLKAKVTLLQDTVTLINDLRPPTKG
jgi:anti-sigma factor RsiW